MSKERTKEEFSVWKTVGFSRRARGFEASEPRRHSVGSAGRDAEPERAESAFLGSERGGLHVESAIDSYEEVILQ